MRIAFFSPLNPQRSGISDYSEELLPYLAAECSIDVVVDNYLPASPEIRQHHAVLTPAEFMRNKARYDAVVYQVGNSLEYHGYMIPCLREVPGVVVLHDYSLGYLTLGLTLAYGDRETVARILETSVGKEQARRLTRQLLLGQLDSYRLSLARPVVEMSTGVIVHNRFALDKLQAEYPGHPVRMIWHATPVRETLGDKASLRSKYGVAPDDFLIVSVSRLAYNKRLDLALRVLSQAVRENPRVRLTLVGEGELGGRARQIIKEQGLERHVLQTGWVTASEYLDYIDMADAAIDLRHPTAGETSGGSLRLLQAGKPIVATAQGFFLELPGDCCLRVTPGEAAEEANVLGALRRLWSEPVFRERMAGAARNFALTYLRREQAAAAYVRFLKEVRESPGQPQPWRLPGIPDSKHTATATKLIYNCSRTLQYAHRYGVSGTLSRILEKSLG
jgi:glycosyltransferase involved in cell wall biosynthesis